MSIEIMENSKEMRSQTYIIELSGLSVGYKKGSAVISGIDLKLEKGTVAALIGANGSGKSTLLKTLIGELKPLAGTVMLDGRPMESYSRKERAKSIAILMTDRVSPGFMTAKEVVALGRYPYTDITGRLSPADEEAMEKALRSLRLKELSDRRFNTLSDGQKQLVLLAKAVCQEPELLIMDEPASFLDINYKLELMRMVKELSAKGVTVVMSVHEPELAREIPDLLVCIHGGKVVRTGAPEEIFTEKILGEIYETEDLGLYKKYL
ncbi:MAG: ABC transporter ATP-binding protein [Lachnospiraceae bacterium]|nr:ABC transporter ATP-binding protein [Lachnospiraceae bacterium]HAV00167.1 hypothetical protein [Lachnospiraceae bacterium]